jgi:hypothetical protein
MAARKKSKPAPAKPKRDAGAWATATQVATVAATVVLVLGLFAGLALGRSGLQSLAAEAHHAESPGVKVAFDWPTLPAEAAAALPAGAVNTWLPAETREVLERLTLAELTDDPFDGASLARAHAALAATGWFASGLTLGRESGGVVHVHARWRMPYAVVRARNTDRLVTYTGEALDKLYEPGKSGLVAVVNPSRDNAPSPGDAWPGGDVQPALALVEFLRENLPAAAYAQIEAVDAADFLRQGKRQLVIMVKGGGRVTWGGPVDQPLPGEEASAVKVKHLATLHQRTGRIDAGRPNIDVRYKTVLIESALANVVPAEPTTAPVTTAPTKPTAPGARR